MNRQLSRTQSRLTRPWLWLPSQFAHDLGPFILPAIAGLSNSGEARWQPSSHRNLQFRNPLGIAGGVDKSGRTLPAWKKLGAGFLEVGTVTPEPQGPNPGRIMDRDMHRGALWNKMGFPNAGSKALLKRLQNCDLSGTPLFVNIGKNRWTENKLAHQDYLHCVEKLYPVADAFVINLSSPNTKGLRDLLSEQDLRVFLSSFFDKVGSQAAGLPYFLKLSPDMTEETLEMVLSLSHQYVDGWILTNTTKSRSPGMTFPVDSGGVSGAPLRPLSRQALAVAIKYRDKLSEKKLVISAGGISDPSEIQFRLEMGADLLQFYSSLVFEGPFFFRKMLKALKNS